MPLLHEDGTGVITYRFAGAGISGEAAVTMGIQTSDEDVEQVAARAMADFKVGMMFQVCHLVNLIGVKAALMVNGNVEVGEDFTGTPFAGQASGGALPMQCAVLIQKRTGFSGRKNRGRFYMPGVGIGHVASTSDPNTLTSDSLIAWQAKADEYLGLMKSSTASPPLNPMVLHPVTSPAGPAATEIQAFSVQARLASQRGRIRD